MFSRPVLALSCAVLAFSAGGAAAAEVKIASREYKLMLDPAKFTSSDRVEKANKLWREVKKISAKELGKKDGEARAQGSFKEGKERTVLFRDTEGCVLKKQNYTFRERQDLDNGEPEEDGREVTLKLRTPDMFIAAAAHARAKGDPEEPEVKFEEDVAPLLRALPGTVAFASPASARSLFSVSVTHETVAADEKFETLRDITKRYPDLKKRLERGGTKPGELNAALKQGEQFHEFVLKGAKIDFGKDKDKDKETNAKFDLTLWYPKNTSGAAPVTAELSYKHDVDDGKVGGGTAERAFKLFTALQEGLDGWTSPGHETKTYIGLLADCQDR
jgi:hypothetical protein